MCVDFEVAPGEAFKTQKQAAPRVNLHYDQIFYVF